MKPVELLVHESERARELGGAFVRAFQTMTQISFGIDGDEVGHAVVIAIPEVFETSRLIAGHAKAITVTSEVRLSH